MFNTQKSFQLETIMYMHAHVMTQQAHRYKDGQKGKQVVKHASETNFVTGGGAAVCKAEKQGLKGREERQNADILSMSEMMPCHSKNIESCSSENPSETKHTVHFQHANKQTRCKMDNMSQ